MPVNIEALEELRVAISQFGKGLGLTFDETMEIIIDGHLRYLKKKNGKIRSPLRDILEEAL